MNFCSSRASLWAAFVGIAMTSLTGAPLESNLVEGQSSLVSGPAGSGTTVAGQPPLAPEPNQSDISGNSQPVLGAQSGGVPERYPFAGAVFALTNRTPNNEVIAFGRAQRHVD